MITKSGVDAPARFPAARPLPNSASLPDAGDAGVNVEGSAVVRSMVTRGLKEVGAPSNAFSAPGISVRAVIGLPERLSRAGPLTVCLRRVPPGRP